MSYSSTPISVVNTQTVVYNKVRGVIGNAAAIDQKNAGFLSVKASPCNFGRNVFNVGFEQNELVLRGVIAAVGTDQKFCLRSSASTHAIFDAFAYLSAASMYRAVLTNPVRLLSHTGDGLINRRGLVKKGVKLTLDIGALAGVPQTVKGVMLTVTVVNPVEARGALRMYPCQV
jgi:hypothetical protein